MRNCDINFHCLWFIVLASSPHSVSHGSSLVARTTIGYSNRACKYANIYSHTLTHTRGSTSSSDRQRYTVEFICIVYHSTVFHSVAKILFCTQHWKEVLDKSRTERERKKNRQQQKLVHLLWINTYLCHVFIRIDNFPSLDRISFNNNKQVIYFTKLPFFILQSVYIFPGHYHLVTASNRQTPNSISHKHFKFAHFLRNNEKKVLLLLTADDEVQRKTCDLFSSFVHTYKIFFILIWAGWATVFRSGLRRIIRFMLTEVKCKQKEKLINKRLYSLFIV